MSGRMVVCEPQCWGFEHAQFNAALLDTVLWAYPQADAVFLAEPGHLEWVRRSLARHDPAAAARVEWRPLRIPVRRLWGWRRLKDEWAWSRAVCEAGREAEAPFILVCSLTGPGLLALKMRLFGGAFGSRVLAVPHGTLASVAGPQSRRPWAWALAIRQVLRLPHPPQLRYVALGEAVRESLAAALPSAAAHFASLDPPYFMEERTEGTVEGGPVRFGFLGAATAEKGFETFARLARDARAAAGPEAAAEFWMAGFLPEASLRDGDAGIRGVSPEPLTEDEYGRRVAALTYVVSTADAEHYRLTASASFLDALAYAKPGIYLRNRYLEDWFVALGDIGYLCEGYEDLLRRVVELMRACPGDRYQLQCENIRLGRERFAPRNLAARLRAIAGTS